MQDASGTSGGAPQSARRRGLSPWAQAFSGLLSLGALVGVVAIETVNGGRSLTAVEIARADVTGTSGAAAPSAPGLCGDPRLSGALVEPFQEGGGCGAQAPISLTHVAGVRLTPVAITECGFAGRLADWIQDAVQPAATAGFGVEVSSIRHMSAYACRRRNNSPTGPLSLHATARALDVGSFTLTSGLEIGVKSDWGGDGAAGTAGATFLKRTWREACGPFTTVLGPLSDAAHRDHFHFDTAPRRTPYCR